jgi:hypothetical protein
MKNIAVLAMAMLLLGWWVVKPLYLYGEGTSRNVSVKVIAEPFLEADGLVYEWSGDVFRSCPVEIRRAIIDAKGVETTFVTLPFKRTPTKYLGETAYEVTVRVPEQISEGPAVYQATEVSDCDWMQRLFPRPVDYPPVNFTVTR